MNTLKKISNRSLGVRLDRDSQRRRRNALRRSVLERLEPRHLLAVELISVTPPPLPDPPEAGNDYSTNPVINGNGRFIAFQSHADNLISGADTNDTQDVFVRDLVLGTTVLISINADGTDSGTCEGSSCAATSVAGSFYPDISDDGRYIAFVSYATDLVKGVEFDVTPNVFVRDRDADADGVFDESGPGESTTTLLSIGIDGTAAGIFGASSTSTRPVISGNGKFVIFTSGAADMLVDEPLIIDTNGTGTDLYRAPVEGGAVSRINVDGTGSGTGFGTGTVFDFSTTTTGDLVTFGTTNPGLISAVTGTFDDTNARPDIFIGGGNTPVELVTVNALGTGPGNEGSREGVVSRNGRHVAFFSAATDLVGAVDDNLAEDLFVRDLKTGITSLVSRRSGTGPLTTGDGPTPPSTLLDNDISAGPAISDDGRFIAYRTAADDLVDIDTNSVSDIILYDRDTDGDGVFDEPGATENRLVTVNAAGTASADHTGSGPGTAGSSIPTISRDGRYVAFASTGRDLIEGGTPLPGGQVYIRDMVTGVTSLVSVTSTGASVGPDGTTPATRPLAMSRDGSRIAFQTDRAADELDASVTDPPSGSPVPFGEIDLFAGTPDADIVLSRNFATGFEEHTQAFRVRFEDVSAFDVGYYRSSDSEFDASDELLGTIAITDPDDLAIDGNRFVTATIGTGSGEIAFPGVGSDDPLEDYFILTVGDNVNAVTEFDADPFNEDNTRALRGLYHIKGPAPVFTHGSVRSDTITATVVDDSLDVEYGATGFGIPGTFTYDLTDVTAVHIRSHDGDDTVTGSDLTEVVFGGPGSDELFGEGGDDMLFGGPGKDFLDGGEGADTLDGGEGPDILLGGPGPDTLVDGPGDDVLDAGPDDDVVMALPGSDNIYMGGDGTDTLDFSLDDLGTFVDLDSTAWQTVDSQGNTAQISGFEHYIGSPSDDHLLVRPLPDISRQLDGGNGTNKLHVDAGGNIVVDDGTKLSFPGTSLGDLVYQNFQEVFVFNGLPQVPIIDDGDQGYSAVGFQATDPQFPQGFGDDVEFADPNDAVRSAASYEFLVTPGRYAVAATWTFAPDRATNTPFRIFSDQTLLEEVRINQELPPSEFTDGGIDWQNIAIVDITNQTLTVEISDDDANEFVIADAVRIEPLNFFPPLEIIVDDESSGGDAGTVHSGGGVPISLLQSVTSFAVAIGGQNNGDNPEPQDGGYRIINWEEGIDDTIAAAPLPRDFYISRGIRVESPGEFRVSSSGEPPTSARFGDLNATYPSTFLDFSPVRIVSPVGSNITDISFFIPGTTDPAGVRGFGAVFTDVDTENAASIEFFDLNGDPIRKDFAQPAPGDLNVSFLGVTFDDPVIASVRIISGNVPLLLSGSPDDITQGGTDDLIVFDDLLYGEPMTAVLPSGGRGSDTFTSDCTPTLGPGFLGDSHECQPGNEATWTFSNLSSGTYLVSATWSPGAERTTNARYTIDNAGAQTEVIVNQQNPPTGSVLASLPWQPLTKIHVEDATTTTVTLTSSDGNFSADALELRLTPDLSFFDFEGIRRPIGSVIQLGQVPLNEQGQATRTREFTIRNDVLTAPLVLDNLQVSGTGFSVSEFGATQLPPGASTTFDVTFSGDTFGPFGGQVTFNSNDFEHPFFVFDVVGEIIEDTTPPVVEIIAPDEGATFIEGTQVDVTGRADDCINLDESCTVTIGNQTALVQPDGSFLIRNIPEATGELRVRVIDPAGNEGEALRTVTLIPDLPPTVQIQQPIDGQTVVEGSTIPIVVDVEDDVQVTSVELRVDGEPVHTFAFEPFVVQIVVPSTIGEHNIEACATDSGSNVICDDVNIVVFPRPIMNGRSIVVAPDAGHAPEVRVFQPDGTLTYRFLAYEPNFLGGVRVATGDITGDGVADIITGAGPSGGPHVKVFDGVSGNEIRSFFAFDPGFLGGVYVASGDVNGDGLSDIITAAGPGGGPHVRVFSGRTNELHADFFAFDPTISDFGVRVGAEDVNGDGQADIITAPGAGGGPHVRVFDGHRAGQFTPTITPGFNDGLLSEFPAFDPGFAGGVFVGSLTLGADRDGSDPGGHVRVIDGSLLLGGPQDADAVTRALKTEFFAFDQGFNGGVRVGSANLNDDDNNDTIAGSGPSDDETESIVKLFDNQGETLGTTITPFVGFSGGLFVAGVKPVRVDVVNLPETGGTHRLERDGNDVVIRDEQDNELGRFPADQSKAIRLNGAPDVNDLLVVKTFGQTIPKLIYDGGTGGFDAIKFETRSGDPPVEYIKYTMTSPIITSISLNRDGDANDPEILAVDLEPIDDGLTVVDREFVFARTDDIVVFDAGSDAADSILRIDSENSEVIDFLAATGTTTVRLGEGSDEFQFGLAIDLLPAIDGQGGSDSLVLTGSENHLDLTDPNQNKPLNIETINIVGASPNELTIDGQSVVDVTDANNSLAVQHDDDDTVNYAGDGWVVEPPIFADGAQRHVLSNGAARVETSNLQFWQNPLLRFDVNFSGDTTALDALQIINFLGRFPSVPVDLADPTSDSELPERYYDVNGSRTASSLDALQVINFLAVLLNQSEGEFLQRESLPVVSPQFVYGLLTPAEDESPDVDVGLLNDRVIRELDWPVPLQSQSTADAALTIPEADPVSGHTSTELDEALVSLLSDSE